jgi:hypothetical protein
VPCTCLVCCALLHDASALALAAPRSALLLFFFFFFVCAAVTGSRQAQVTALPLHSIRVLQRRGAPAAVLHMWHAVWALAAQQQCVLAAGQPQPGRLLEPCIVHARDGRSAVAIRANGLPVPTCIAVTCRVTLALLGGRPRRHCCYWLHASLGDCCTASGRTGSRAASAMQWQSAHAAHVCRWQAVQALVAQRLGVLAAGQLQPRGLLLPCLTMVHMCYTIALCADRLPVPCACLVCCDLLRNASALALAVP